MSPSHCRYHPQRAARGFCAKYEHGYCEECLETCTAKCTDPKLYCRHRTYCLIWERCRKGAAQGSPPDEASRGVTREA